MKVAIMSDLHLEYDARHVDRLDHRGQSNAALDFYLKPPQPEADLLVLAGDVHSGALAIDWAAHHFAVPTILIAGNHEFYGHELFRTIAFNRQRAGTTNGQVIFLERATWEVKLQTGERARFICATLWTDFRLYRTPEASMAIAQERLEDFEVVIIERGYKLRKLRPNDTTRLHRASVAFLRRELDRPFDGITVVVTHHAPSPRSIAPKFQNDPLNPAFASNLDTLIYNYEPALWIHGHMHDSFDYRVGPTRVVCNPRGYFPDQLNPGFDPSLVVEVKQSSVRAEGEYREGALRSLRQQEVIDGFGGTADSGESRRGWSPPSRRNG
jgi:predicted phosphodiesterase